VEFMPNKKIKIYDSLVLDIEKGKVYVQKSKVDLTYTEYKILQLLAENLGRVFARDQIIGFVNEGDKQIIDRTVDVHIRNLREKLGPAGSLIKNVRGIGYKIEE
jgi:DNA-binding response OmpR family regulator